MNTIDLDFIKSIEQAHFRTSTDTGANLNALLIWNCVREHVGLPRLTLGDLPAFCLTHNKCHVIQEEYGCCRERKILTTGLFYETRLPTPLR